MGNLKRLLAWLLLALVAWPAFAGQDHVLGKSLLEDPGGQLDIGQVALAQADFTPAPALPAMGYTRAVHWIRFTVQPRADGGDLVLRLRPSHIDRITLFEPDPRQAGHWTRRVTGERTPWAEREQASAAYGFVVRPLVPTTYYLRLDNSRSSILQVQALAPTDARRADVLLGWAQWAFLSVMACILAWSLFEFAQHREAVVAWFTLAQAAYLLYGMAITGQFAPLLPTAGYLAELTVALVCVAELGALAFHRQFLGLFDPPGWMRRVLDALILASACAMLLCLAGQPLRGLWLNGVVALSAGPVFFLLALRSRRDAPPGLRTLRLLYGLLMASLLITFAPLLGLLPASPWNLQGGLIQGLLGAGMMGSMLFMRSRALRRQGLQARMDLDRAQSQVQAQRTRLEEQQHFMAMLTHEIKNPLATIRLTLDMLQGDESRRQRIGRAITDVEAILERCRQVDRLEQGDWPSDSRVCVLAQLVDDVAAHGKEPWRIRVTHEPPDATVHTDPLLLSMALGNLIDNALKYGAAAPVEVRTHPWTQGPAPQVAVTVSNQAGPGGPPDGSRLFSKYHRGAEALGKSGSGLGLYLVRGIMDRLGGAVSHTSSGERVSFTLTLPVESRP